MLPRAAIEAWSATPVVDVHIVGRVLVDFGRAGVFCPIHADTTVRIVADGEPYWSLTLSSQ